MSQVFHNIAKPKSITMQMVSDFMHFHTIALRQKIATRKMGGYNIRSVYIWSKLNLIKLVARDRSMPILIIILITQFE